MSFLEKIIEPRKQIPEERKRFDNNFLKQLILPLFIEQLLLMVVGMADTMMVTYAGEATVSGVSLDTMFYTIFIFMFTAVGTGGAVIVSQYIGSRDEKKANVSASQVFFIALVFSTVCMILVLVFGNGIISLLYGAADPEVQEACRIYLRIVAYSFPANAVYNAGTALYRSMGKTSTTMKVSIAMNLINIAGNAIGIFVLHAGAAGVAWPTTISWYFAAIVMTVLCFNKKHTVYITLKNIFKPNGDMIRRILKVAVPNSIESGLFQAAKVFLGSIIATFGTAQIAANGIGQTIWSVAACVSSSMSPAFVTVIGQCIGGKDTEAAEYYIWKMTRITTLLAAAWNLLILALLPAILPLYDISAETRSLLIIIVIIHNVFCGSIGALFGPFSAGLRAAGDVKFTMYASIFCTVVFRTLLSVVLAVWLHMGVIGIAIAMVSDWSLKAIILVARQRSGKWLEHQLI